MKKQPKITTIFYVDFKSKKVKHEVRIEHKPEKRKITGTKKA